MKYLFTDTDLAAQRLKYLAEVYADSSREFILDAITDRPRLVLDLGCGPGYTTHFLAEITQCDQAVGLDNSAHFISLADRTKTDNVRFYLHDITSIPFPVAPGDLLFCRYLLTHLRCPCDVIAKWATQLRSKGLLLIEEVEWIHTKNEVFTVYLDIVAAMLANQGNQLYVGPILNTLEATDTLKKRSNRVRSLQVRNCQAATMFYMNIQSWKRQPFIQSNYTTEMIDRLEGDLRALTTDSSNTSEIEWGLRQLVFERV